MRWKKAHRNKNRLATRTQTVRIPKSYFFNPASVSWQEWLKKILPNLLPTLDRDSIIARLMRKPKPTPTWRTQLPRLPSFRGIKTNLETLRKQVQNPVIVFDDIEILYPLPSSRYFKIIPPEPVRLKTFIYGDQWVAYRRVC